MAYRWRASLRGRLVRLAVIALLLALAGGVAMAALAAARRTDTAYGRFLAAAGAADVVVDLPTVDQARLIRPVSDLPEVVEVSSSSGLLAAAAGPDGQPDLARIDQVLGSIDGRMLTHDRPAVLEGRLADPARADEAVVNRHLHEAAGIGVGDTVDLVVTSQAELQAADDEGRGPRFEPARVTVTGVVLMAEEVVQDDIGRSTRLAVTPAFVAAHPDSLSYRRIGLRLARGDADVPAVQQAVQQVVREVFAEDASGGGAVGATFEVTTDFAERVDRAMQPAVGALVAFGVVAAVVALLVVGQLQVRELADAGAETSTLSALGFTRGQVVAGAALTAGVVGLAGAVGAVAVALALSPLAPVGAVAAVEPQRGLVFDAVVLGLGAGALVALFTAIGTAAGVRRSRPPRSIPARPPLAGRLGAAGLPPAAAVGVAAALDGGRGPRAVPVRATLAGATLAIGAVVAALCFGASLERLLDTPAEYGWEVDAVLQQSSGYEPIPDDVVAAVAVQPGVAGVAQVDYESVRVDGLPVAALGVTDHKGAWAPPLVSGRAPTGPDEVVAGLTVLEELDKRLGDQLTLSGGEGERTLTIVGSAVFPAIGRVDGARTGLGEGIALPATTLETVSAAFPNDVLVTYADGADAEATTAAIRALAHPPGDPANAIRRVLVDQRPAAIVNADEVVALPYALSAALAVVGAGALTHLLVTSVRRRRRELAVLAVLGFSRRARRATVAWQATTVAVVGVGLGVPLGILVGRLAWSAFADELGTVADPALPVLAVVAVAAGALVLANAVAAGPARAAARVEPAAALRAE